MVYPPEDGHPSRYKPGPTCVNFVHATNATNHYAMPPTKMAILRRWRKSKRATKLIIKLKNKPNTDILIHLNLPTVKYKHLRGDLIDVFKIIQSIYDETVSLHLPSYARANTR